MSGLDLVAVPRDLLAAACYCARKYAGPDSETYKRLSALALSPAEATYAGRPLSEIAASTFHPGDLA